MNTHVRSSIYHTLRTKHKTPTYNASNNNIFTALEWTDPYPSVEQICIAQKIRLSYDSLEFIN